VGITHAPAELMFASIPWLPHPLMGPWVCMRGCCTAMGDGVVARGGGSWQLATWPARQVWRKGARAALEPGAFPQVSWAAPWGLEMFRKRRPFAIKGQRHSCTPCSRPHAGRWAVAGDCEPRPVQAVCPFRSATAPADQASQRTPRRLGKPLRAATHLPARLLGALSTRAVFPCCLRATDGCKRTPRVATEPSAPSTPSRQH
jgi:hypothetical protein